MYYYNKKIKMLKQSSLWQQASALAYGIYEQKRSEYNDIVVQGRTIKLVKLLALSQVIVLY
jgi:hypothetical protein